MGKSSGPTLLLQSQSEENQHTVIPEYIIEGHKNAESAFKEDVLIPIERITSKTLINFDI